MGVHLSIKAKLVLAASAGQELKSTMEEFNRACNTLSELAFQQDLHRKYDCVAVTSDKKFHTAKNIRHKKACYKRTRRSLQANGSKSAKRALKRVSGRERRFVADTNHRVSKQIVADAKANNQRIVLEDLNGIRETGMEQLTIGILTAQLA